MNSVFCRVASFVDGEGHLSQLEMSLYDEEMSRISLLDSSDNEDGNSENNRRSGESFGPAEMTSSSASPSAAEISPDIGPSSPLRAGTNNHIRKSARDVNEEIDGSEDSGNTEN